MDLVRTQRQLVMSLMTSGFTREEATRRVLIEQMRQNSLQIPPDWETMPFWNFVIETNNSIQANRLTKIPNHYFLTLTTTQDSPHTCLETYNKVLRRFDVKAAAIELTKAGKPHVHILLSTGDSYINKQHIKRWHPYGIDLKKLKTQADVDRVKEYIRKPETKPTEQWLQTYGLQNAMLK